ncbi:MAG TPA: cytochrome c3 family protein [Allosphingosinicella sp.]|nr:cytochrome c3 family protein [Allosphingosinicella sp.]
MAFLIRTISHSADGREIVRNATIDDDLIKVGRDPICDIRLNDLAIALHHASIEQLSGGRLGISAEMGLSVEINGSATGFGHLNVHQGGDIRIGPFLLRVLPTAAGVDDVSIEVERGEDDAASEKIDVSRFALASVMPGKRPMAWLSVALVLAVFLAWPIFSFYANRGSDGAATAQGYHADKMWTSGPLSQGHAALRDNCQACHVTPFVPVQDDSCKTCHTGIHDHADLARLQRANPELGGFRRIQQNVGAFFGQGPGRCVECHTEHEGPQEIPPTPQQFCSDCHTDLRSRLPDTRLASASDFEDGHPEFQPAVLIDWTGEQPNMQRVTVGTGQARERSNLKFPHALHLNPRGGAAQMGRRLASRYGFGDSLQCRDCHVPTPDGTRFQPIDMEADCGMCHSLAFDQIGGTIRTLRHGSPAQVIGDLRALYRAGGPERPAELAAGERDRPGDVAQIRAAVQFARARASLGARADQAIRGVFSQGGACFDCHEIVQPPPGTLNYGIQPVAFPTRYMLHGWFDHRAHQVVQRPGQPRLDGAQACASCHNAPGSNQATDLLLPDLASCRVCHGGEATSLPVPSTCAMCHDFHMDGGTPAMLLRQRVRGHRWETVTIPVRPPPPQTRPPAARR